MPFNFHSECHIYFWETVKRLANKLTAPSTLTEQEDNSKQIRKNENKVCNDLTTRFSRNLSALPTI